MATRWTDEGRAAGGVPRDPVTGKRIPREDLTWRDADEEIIPKGDLSYDHRQSVSNHWNTRGRFTTPEERADFYNDVDNLVPMAKGPNSSKGGEPMNQTTGTGYKPRTRVTLE